MRFAPARPLLLAGVLLGTCGALFPCLAEPAALRRLVTAVEVNGAPGGEWMLLERDGRLHATTQALQSWRIPAPAEGETWTDRGATWIPLDRLAGFRFRLDEARQTMVLDFDAGVFEASRLAPDARQADAVAAREHAVFLNYDTSFSSSQLRARGTQNQLGALVELGWTGPAGLLTSSHIARGGGSSATSLQRLETAFTHDDPASQLTWRLGDTSTRASAWARSSPYGGIQVGRNFRLSPGFVTQPIPVLAGTASAPSTLELYVNDTLRQVSQVPSGPFALDGLTGLTSSGQARIVLRDSLGRETVVLQDFFTPASLLKAGLSDWSLEAGALRRGLSAAEDGYGSGFAAVLWRQGLSDTLTVESRVELARRRQAAGAGLSMTLGTQWFAQAALATSRGEAGEGVRWVTQLEASPSVRGLGVRVEGASRDFRQLGQSVQTPPSRLQLSLGWALLSERKQSLRVFLGELRSHDGPHSRTRGVVYSRNFGAGGYLSVSANSITSAGQSLRSLLATWVLPWDSLQASGQLTRRDGQLEASATVFSTPSSPSAAGWRVSGGQRAGSVFAEGSVYQQTPHAWLSADASASREQQALRLGARGALVAMGGNVFATPRLDESFALVDVGGLAGIGVGHQGDFALRTDSRGQALVPRLQAFVANQVSLNPEDLPLTANLDSTQLAVTPARRSAARLSFPVRSGFSALLRIVFDDGEPAPLGARITRVGDEEAFMVARGGMAYVSGLQARDVVELRWKAGSCRMDVQAPEEAADVIVKLGPLQCTGVPR